MELPVSFYGLKVLFQFGGCYSVSLTSNTTKPQWFSTSLAFDSLKFKKTKKE